MTLKLDITLGLEENKMTELTSPPLRNCPFCNTEPETERGWEWKDLSVTFLRVVCPKCRHSTYWVKYIPEDLASLQHAIDETSHSWNSYEIPDDDD